MFLDQQRLQGLYTFWKERLMGDIYYLEVIGQKPKPYTERSLQLDHLCALVLGWVLVHPIV